MNGIKFERDKNFIVLLLYILIILVKFRQRRLSFRNGYMDGKYYMLFV